MAAMTTAGTSFRSSTLLLSELWSLMTADGMGEIYARLVKPDAQRRWPWLVAIHPCQGDRIFYQNLLDARAWCHDQLGPPGDRWIWWMVAAIPHDSMMVRTADRADHALMVMRWQ